MLYCIIIYLFGFLQVSFYCLIGVKLIFQTENKYFTQKRKYSKLSGFISIIYLFIQISYKFLPIYLSVSIYLFIHQTLNLSSNHPHWNPFTLIYLLYIHLSIYPFSISLFINVISIYLSLELVSMLFEINWCNVGGMCVCVCVCGCVCVCVCMGV